VKITHPQYKQELTDYHDNNPIIENSTVLKKWKIGTHLIFSKTSTPGHKSNLIWAMFASFGHGAANMK